MALVFNVQKGTFTLASVGVGINLNTEVGAFALSGTTVAWKQSYVLPAQATSYHLTGANAVLATPADGVERTIDVSLRFPTPVTSTSIKFLPDLSAGDGLVVLEKYYTLTLTSDSPTNILSGSIALPTLSTRSIPYRVQFPKETGFNEHYIYLNAGTGAIELSSLLNLASAVNGTIDLNDLNDVTITAAASGEYLRYNGTEWADSAIQVGDLPASVMLKTTYDTDLDGVVDKAEQVTVVVRNDEGTPMTIGTLVYISGANGNNLLVKRAQANDEDTSSKTFGMVIEPITNGGDGKVALAGTVTGVNLQAFAAGSPLWLSATTAGGLVDTKPVPPNHAVFAGWVAKNTTNGVLELHIQNGYEIDELHDVLLTDLADGQILVYDEDTELWKNETPLGGTGEANKIAVWSGSQALTSDANLHWDTTNDRLGINTTAPNGSLEIAQGSGTNGLIVTRQTADATPVRISIRKSRGTPSSPAMVEENDTVGTINFTPYTGSGFSTRAYINAYVDGEVVSESDEVPTSLQFGTGASDTAVRMTVRYNGKVTVNEIGSAVDSISSILTVKNFPYSENVRFRYDSTNYSSVAVSSTGVTTFTADGSAPKFVFSNAKVQAIVIPGVTTGVPDINDEVQPNPDTNGLFSVSPQADVSFLGPEGSPVDGQKLLIRIVGDAFAHNLTFDSSYKDGSVELPATSLISKTQYLGFFYSTSSSKWELVGYTEV
jgi:hypothetical protein